MEIRLTKQIWKLHMTVTKKIAVTAIMLLGVSYGFLHDDRKADMLMDIDLSLPPSSGWRFISLRSTSPRLVLMLIQTVSIHNYPSSRTLTHLKVAVTTLLWWSILESGLALIAACLPTMSYLVSHFSMRAIIYSVRDMLSLPSYTSFPKSTRIPSKTTLGPAVDDKVRSSKDDSRSHIYPGIAGSSEVYALETKEPLESGIRITRDVELARS